MDEKRYTIGIIGLGTMGKNLAVNIADHGFSVAGYDKDPNRYDPFRKEVSENQGGVARTLEEFVGMLENPRNIILLVPAGKVVDDVIEALLPLLDRDDLIMDAGNSNFKDTNRREEYLFQKQILFMGVGLSGGEEGARRGPSIMPGGPREAYDRVAPIFEAIAAHFGSDACVTYLGPHSAGHYVKMVHNGIEYGLMALIAETYDLMKRSLGFSDDQLHDVYAEWNKEKLQSFLIEITSIIFQQVDEETGQRMIDLILDKADQMGTGMWTTESALELHVPAPTIDMGVEMRDLSVQKELREMESQMLAGPNPKYQGVPEVLVKQMENALHVGMILTYNQGLALLRKASEAYGYNFDLAEIIRIWRGGCIIRSALLNDILDAYRNNADLPDLLLDEEIGEIIQTKQKGLRAVVVAAAQTGIPAPGFMACLAYLDSCRSSWLPASLIQAQRDYFGAHAYHRVDMAGQFHTHWQE